MSGVRDVQGKPGFAEIMHELEGDLLRCEDRQECLCVGIEGLSDLVSKCSLLGLVVQKIFIVNLGIGVLFVQHGESDRNLRFEKDHNRGRIVDKVRLDQRQCRSSFSGQM